MRLDDNTNFTTCNGKNILGRISMDSFSVEGEDNEVCIFNDVTKLAILHSTIKYEILVRLNPFLKRLIV